MILFNTHRISILETILTADGKCIIVDIGLDGSRYHIINTYFPNVQKDQLSFITSLYPLVSSKYPVIWGGDFNIVLNGTIDRYPSTTIADGHSSDLKQLLDTFDLQDVCRMKYPLRSLFSFRRGLSKSRIDQFYVSRNVDVLNYQHEDFPSSDHDVISTTIVHQNKVLKGRGFWRNRTKMYNDENFITKFKQFWAENLKRNRKHFSGSWWLETKFQIKKFLIKMNNEQDGEKNDEIVGTKISLERKKFLTTLYPENKRISKEYFDCKKDLAKKQINQIKNKVVHDQASDLAFGDLPTKAFFINLKRFRVNEEPSEIYTTNGLIEKNPKKILEIAKKFFENKFKPCRLENENVLAKFLNQLQALEDNDLDRMGLMRLVTLEELEDIIMSFKNGKCPGIDGLSIEFYKKTFGIIKHHLLNFINDSIFGKQVPRKINTGIIKLLYKDGDRRDLKNYRPITLMNVDLKIITKIFTRRLQPILSKVLHPDQFAQPGKQISDLNCVVRDILEEMENGDQDNFFIKFDFAKAFDSINQNFLFQCLAKMNFPQTFIIFLKKLYNNAVSKVMVNGHLSKAFKLSRGSRQGDPLSLYLFIIVLNALLIFLNFDPCLIPYKSRSNKKFLTQAFADDLNVTTSSLSTILRIFYILDDFRKVSGLKVNLGKTRGFFFNKTGCLEIDHLPLPSTNWNVNMKILGIPYGDKNYVKQYWKDIVKDIQTSLTQYNEVYSTFDAKSIITKSLVLPKVSYIATVLDIPNEIKRSIESLIFKYIIPKGKTFIDLFDLAQKRHFGGYNIDYTTIHATVFSLIPIFKYVKSKMENIPLTKDQFFIEYNLGLPLANILKIPVNNRTPHRITPMKQYANILKFLREMNITKDDLIRGKVKFVYEKIIFSKNKIQHNFSKWGRLHIPALPNYLRTFNYKASIDILPVKTKFVEFGLDTDSRCNFCKLHPDTVFHMFNNCTVLLPIWVFLDKVMYLMSFSFSFSEARKMCAYDLLNTNLKEDEKVLVIYLNTITNHKIWQFSMKIQYEGYIFDLRKFISSLVKTIDGRKKVESSGRIKHCQKIDKIEMLSRVVKIACASLVDVG